MSAALVRKALELSSETDQGITKKSKKKSKNLKPKKKPSQEELLKKKLKLLKAISYKPKADQAGNSDSKKKKKSKEKTAFTDEDFKKFEEEYFVTE